VFEAFARRDLDAVLELIDPAVEFHAVTGELAREGEPYRGVDGMRDYFADVGKIWQELSLDPTEFRLLGESGTSVLVTGRVWAHGSGRVVDSSAGWIWRLREGRVTYIRVYASAAAAEQAAGAEA
jgi:ketosteroid isomerase-like protein